MERKAAKTSAYIVKTVAPIFNKNGYAATTMADIIKATGLTKGAIYGNFENKEALAYAAFKYMIKGLMQAIATHMSQSKTAIGKLLLISDFYKKYDTYTNQMGGCPVLNIGVDANNQNSKLLQKVRNVIERIQAQLAEIIQTGIDNGEIHQHIDPLQTAKRIDTMIQGAIFMAHTMNDQEYIHDTMQQVDELIVTQLKK